ncbi:uncharacterized protein LOC122668174 [Telopea speciosissima]|uniref:uncharacterized protein LOC122668174 n=1 Tax=Telopea speciosissima TaxID=54955 RepID=UPI001CC3D139|nr:uncharacterized protein LOC122668174 [Telopea speciosissima]
MALKQKRLKNFWNKWELEISILLSLLLQIILGLTANLRKRRSSKLVAFVLWMAYLAADWVATFYLGIISSILNDSRHQWYNPDFLAFWTPFLLLHLGGPDTITAFSLEHSVLKYGERTWSLKQASMGGLRNSLIKKRDAGPNYPAVMEDFSSDLRAGNPGMLTVRRQNQNPPEYSIVLEDPSSNSISIDPKDQQKLLYGAYLFFQTFKRLFVDLILTFQDRQFSMSIFSHCNSTQAYNMIETELSYAYDILYTKSLVVHTAQGYIFRWITSSSSLIAFCLFFYKQQHHQFKHKDIVVSYILLAGALVIEFVSIGMLIFSDWTVVMLQEAKSKSKSKLKLKLKWKLAEWLEKPVFQIISAVRRFSKHRWSNQMGQYSLLSYIVYQPKHLKLDKFQDILGLKEMCNEYSYIKYKPVTDDLKELIFGNLKEKSKEQDKGLNTRKGQWAMKLPRNCSLPEWIINAEFDESLIMWHLSTEICYKLQKKKVNSSIKEDDSSNQKKEGMLPDHRLASKAISRYLLYLLLSRPITMSSIAGLAAIRHGDTCEEANKFFEEERMTRSRRDNKFSEEIDKFEAIKSLMMVHTYVRAQEVKGDKSKSILWDAVELARKLQELPENERWEIASHVWIEMLSYAARNCRGNYHAQTLAVGGELLTFVWLMEAHFGMGGHYQIKSGEFKTSYTEVK